MSQPAYPPTAEQQHAIDLFASGQNTVIEALAGTGKTSTLQFIAQQARGRRGLYAAFNKAIATEAAQKFAGTSVTAKTMHALAYAQFGAPMSRRLADRSIQQWAEKGDLLGIHDKFAFPSGHGSQLGGVSRQKLVGLATATVRAYMQSDADTITPDLVPIPIELAGLRADIEAELASVVAGFATRYWEDLTRPDGKLKYEHSAYFKQFALSRPRLPYDFIMLDEAQDSDPLTVQIIAGQDAQVITVGDTYQSIYGWRGATDAMNLFDGARSSLTQSFRFGDDIAQYANRWLELMGAHLRLQGMPGYKSSVFRAERRRPDAILTRTNAGAIQEIVQAQTNGFTTGIAGEKKAREIRDLAKGALDLQVKRHTSQPELSSFNTWSDVVAYAASDEGEDLKPLVDVIEKYTAQKVIAAIDRCVPHGEPAEVTVSTAHVSKGLEWVQVQIAEDFHAPAPRKGVIQPIPAEEARLAYVASTRAQRHLDARGLDWLDGYLADGGWVEGNVLGGDLGAVHVQGTTSQPSDATAREKALR